MMFRRLLPSSPSLCSTLPLCSVRLSLSPNSSVSLFSSSSISIRTPLFLHSHYSTDQLPDLSPEHLRKLPRFKPCQFRTHLAFPHPCTKLAAMSLPNELHSPSKPSTEIRKILGPGGNRARVSEPIKPATAVKPTTKKQSGADEKPAVAKIRFLKTPSEAVRKNASVDSFCSSDSSSSSSSSSSLSATSSKTASSSRRRVRVLSGGSRMVSVKAAPEASPTTPAESGPNKRCDWITAHSEPLYVSFHDEEWGVPIRDDAKLFELFVLSMALAEHSWVSILSKRDTFRKHFDNFEPSSVAKFSEEKLLLLSSSGGGNALLSEPKIRAVVDNAKQVLKIQEEFGSFSNYCWRFVNNKPARNGYRYSRQVPVKTPKSEVISKDLIRRGFRCVGPTVVYSFMQVCGMVNDHLMSCYRYNECNEKPKKESSSKLLVDGEGLTGGMEKMSLSQEC